MSTTLDRYFRDHLVRYLWWIEHPWAGELPPAPHWWDRGEYSWRMEIITQLTISYARDLVEPRRIFHRSEDCEVCSLTSEQVARGASAPEDGGDHTRPPSRTLLENAASA